MSDQIKVGEISPFFITWIFINKNCFMKQIFEILQEERNRILNLHENATQNQYLIISEENAIMKKGRELVGTDTKFTFKDTEEAENTQGGSALKFFGGTTFVPSGTQNLLKTTKPVTVQFADPFGNTGSSGKGTIYWSCSKGKFYVKNINPDNLNQLYGYDETKKTYYFDGIGAPKYTGALKQVCENDKKVEQPKISVSSSDDVGIQGTDNSNKNKYVLEKDHTLYNSDKKPAYKVLKDSSMTFYPEKNGAAVKVATLDNKPNLNTWFSCKTAKFSAKSQFEEKTFFFYTDKPFADFLLKKCEKLKTGLETENPPNKLDNSQRLRNTRVSVVSKPNDTALDQILAKIKTPNPEVKPPAPQKWEG